MSRFNRVLCPVDLSEYSLAAIELATTIARESGSKIIFMYVAPQSLPEEVTIGSDYIRSITEEDKKEFEKLRPSDKSIQFEHIFRHGNAGPEIVLESKRCDVVVLSTRGYGAVLRLLMGSVAQYTLRNAECRVVLVRIPHVKKTNDSSDKNSRHFVTNVMHQVTPIHEHDNIDEVLAELDQANESAAPVVNTLNKVIGVLTKTDIARYRSLQERFKKKDPTVVEEMFEFDKYGHVRPGNQNFDQVKRHMSSPVISISNTETTQHAIEMFKANQSIHHLVVVDENQRPLGIVKPSHCQQFSEVESSANPTSS